VAVGQEKLTVQTLERCDRGVVVVRPVLIDDVLTIRGWHDDQLSRADAIHPPAASAALVRVGSAVQRVRRKGRAGGVGGMWSI
jgi:hypothetical protein